MKKILMFLFLLCVCPNTLLAQQFMNKDSLLRLLPNIKKDTNTVLLYINIGQQYENSEPKIAKKYYIKARDLSKQINYPKGIIKFGSNYSYVLNLEGRYDEGLKINLQSLVIARKINDSLTLAKTLANVGTSYRVKGEFQKAINYYQEARTIFLKLGLNDITDGILTSLYMDMRQYYKAIEYGEKAVLMERKTKNLAGLGHELHNLGLAYLSVRNLNKSKKLLIESFEIGKKIGNNNLKSAGYHNLADISIRQGKFEEAKIYADLAMPIYIEIDSKIGILGINRVLANYNFYKKKYTLANEYLKKALSISKENSFIIEEQEIYTELSNIAFAMQDIKTAEFYDGQSKILSDSIFNDEIKKNTQEFEVKFKTAQKDKNILLLEKKQIKQRTFIYSLATIAIGLLIFSFLLFKNYRARKKINDQEIIQLHQEKIIDATQNMLQGEEQERTRLARDLHDGLGGMLTGVKFQLNSMKGNVILSEENANTFTKSISQIDNAIVEMRRVAHNMMPETLLKFGLDETLKSYCDSVSQSSELTVSYQSFGMKERLEQTNEIVVYRIVQELLNNTIKHAKATKSSIQLTRNGNLISLTVEDNGKGFDVNAVKKNGIGLSNVNHRVEYLNGKMDVKSDKKGTSTHIEFEIA